jgi:hypothetical protein
VDTEQRQSPRKVLKIKALLAMAGTQPIQALTFDIGAQGVGLRLPYPVKPGTLGRIAFDLYFDGRSNKINTQIKAVHCIFGNDEFKVGMLFVGLDPAATAAILQYLR